MVMAIIMVITGFTVSAEKVRAEGKGGAVGKTIEMYRLYNPNSGEHFYTGDVIERDNVIAAGWNDEGIGWIAPYDGDPVYRLYNAVGGEHHYTLDKSERDMLLSVGWNDEGIGWYSESPNLGVALYRIQPECLCLQP